VNGKNTTDLTDSERRLVKKVREGKILTWEEKEELTQYKEAAAAAAALELASGAAPRKAAPREAQRD
jgi:hypothetical protein